MIGENIKRAREAKGLSLRALEQAIERADRIDGLSYSAIQRIESGQRKVASHELAELAEVLGTTTGALLGRTERSASLALAARVSQDLSVDTLGDVKQRAVEILEADDLLSRVVGPTVTSETPTFPKVSASRAGGRELAAKVRERLDLGTAPIADLTAVVENSFRAHVVHQPMQDGTHGFCVTNGEASVIIVNSKDVFGRQRFTLAHELCHLIVGDLDTYELVSESGTTSKGHEGRADDFAAYLLAPDDAVRQAADGRPVDAVGAVAISHRLGISLESAIIRLRTLSLINSDEEAKARAKGPHSLSILAGLFDDYREAQNKQGRTAPPSRLTEKVLAAYDNDQIGIGLVASVIGEHDLERVREVLKEPELELAGAFGDRSNLA